MRSSVTIHIAATSARQRAPMATHSRPDRTAGITVFMGAIRPAVPGTPLICVKTEAQSRGPWEKSYMLPTAGIGDETGLSGFPDIVKIKVSEKAVRSPLLDPGVPSETPALPRDARGPRH